MKVTVELTPNELKATILNGSLYTLTETACAASGAEPETVKLPEPLPVNKKETKIAEEPVKEDAKPTEESQKESDKPEDAPREEPKKEEKKKIDTPPEDFKKPLDLVGVREVLRTIPREKANELVVKYTPPDKDRPLLSNIPPEKYPELLKDVELIKEAEGL